MPIGKREELSRESYKRIKNMNRAELDNYLYTLVVNGYNEGVDYAMGIVANCIDTGVRNTKGVGVKRHKAIIESINKAFRESPAVVVKEEKEPVTQ